MTPSMAALNRCVSEPELLAKWERVSRTFKLREKLTKEAFREQSESSSTACLELKIARLHAVLARNQDELRRAGALGQEILNQKEAQEVELASARCECEVLWHRLKSQSAECLELRKVNLELLEQSRVATPTPQGESSQESRQLESEIARLKSLNTSLNDELAEARLECQSVRRQTESAMRRQRIYQSSHYAQPEECAAHSFRLIKGESHESLHAAGKDSSRPGCNGQDVEDIEVERVDPLHSLAISFCSEVDTDSLQSYSFADLLHAVTDEGELDELLLSASTHQPPEMTSLQRQLAEQKEVTERAQDLIRERDQIIKALREDLAEAHGTAKDRRQSIQEAIQGNEDSSDDDLEAALMASLLREKRAVEQERDNLAQALADLKAQFHKFKAVALGRQSQQAEPPCPGAGGVLGWINGITQGPSG